MRYTWEEISDEWDRIMIFYDGPDSLKAQLYLLINIKNKYLDSKILYEQFYREIDKEKENVLDELWNKSGWTYEEWKDELNRKIWPENYGEPKYSCNKKLVNLSFEYKSWMRLCLKVTDKCVLPPSHSGKCKGYK